MQLNSNSLTPIQFGSIWCAYISLPSPLLHPTTDQGKQFMIDLKGRTLPLSLPPPPSLNSQTNITNDHVRTSQNRTLQQRWDSIFYSALFLDFIFYWCFLLLWLSILSLRKALKCGVILRNLFIILLNDCFLFCDNTSYLLESYIINIHTATV